MSSFYCDVCNCLHPPTGKTDYHTECPHYQADPDPVTTVGRIVFSNNTCPLPRGFTDEELTEIYNRANGITDGKAPPITTQRIFTAMRAMRDLI